ncbi:hypothetical protein [Streptomyces alboniger]|uniref:hypothetical protein n=1 Tax=Streptomyces alboniger TaxID=132473 RepID=UPI00123D7D24|nr:hypothetical protein [Streptomyces alboniger]
MSEAERVKDINLLLEKCLLPHIGRVETPSLTYIDAVLEASLTEYRAFLDPLGVELLYSAKPCTFDFVVRACARRTAGIDVSSPGEARLVREWVGPSVALHCTTPGLSAGNLETVSELADFINVNSLPMLRRAYRQAAHHGASMGLRVNTGRSASKDARYDPARPGSKLGVPPKAFEAWVAEGGGPVIDGLHFHIGCESPAYAAAASSVKWLARVAAPLLSRLTYVNVGGGWLRPAAVKGAEHFRAAVEQLRACGVRRIFTEPGTGIVSEAGVLTARIIDIVDAGKGKVAVLDAHTGQAPETIEYGWKPDLYTPGNEVTGAGRHEYELVGCTPHVGDVFGRYRFRRPLELGQPLFFHRLGAYAHARATQFTGVPLPSIYRITEAGTLALVRKSAFAEYHTLWSTDADDRA